MDESEEEIETDTGRQGRKYRRPRKSKMTRFVHHMRSQSPCSEAILKSFPIGISKKIDSRIFHK